MIRSRVLPTHSLLFLLGFCLSRVKLKFNKLTSTQTLLPLDPYTSNIGLCEPNLGIQLDAENLGEFLQGDRIQNSPYTITMKQDMFCEPVCVSDLGVDAENAMARAIRNEYHQNWLLDDGLPAASIFENDMYIITRYSQGVPLGSASLGHGLPGMFQDVSVVSSSSSSSANNCRTGQCRDLLAPDEVVVFNHVNIQIHYIRIGENRFEITRFLVEPFSIRHEYNGNDGRHPNNTTPIPSCRGESLHTDYDSIVDNKVGLQNQTGKVLFTYDVTWIENVDLPWSHRWDIYLNMDDAIPDQVHWLSIMNTSIVLLICTCVVIRVWRRNISGYTRIISDEAPPPSPEPWHLIKNDVFRAPVMPLALAVGSGTGAQLVATSCLVTVFAVAGWANQSHSGSLSLTTVLVYVLAGFVNGFVAVLYYRIFQGKVAWQRLCLISASAFPLLGMVIFVGLQAFFKAANSTYAVPLMTILVLFALWGGLSLPLVFLGGWTARRRPPIRYPTKVNESIREIPSWTCWDWLWAVLFVLFSASYTFGTMFVEFYYILSSAWMGYYYNSFFFMAMVLLVTVITCGTTSVLYVYYFVFRKQNHCWWWRAFLFGCITGLCSLLYSFLFFRSFHSSSLSAALLFFSDMLLLSLAFSLALGFVALSSAMWFSRRLYGVFQDDSPDDHIEMSESGMQQQLNDGDSEQESSAIGGEMS